MEDPCLTIITEDMVDFSNRRIHCESIMNGVVTQGMTVAFTSHFENMKYLEQLYWLYKDDPHAEFVKSEHKDEMEYL